MSIRAKITMPKIHPIRWRRDGFGTQVIDLPTAGTCVTGKGVVLGEELPRDPIQRGYVKIWKAGAERRVVDRALTVKAARRRIEQIKQQGSAI